MEGQEIVIFKCSFPDAKLSETDVLRASQNLLIPPCLIPNEIFQDKLFLALHVVCGVIQWWMSSSKILAHHKDNRQPEPCVQWGDEGTCPIQQDGLGQQ